MKTFKALSALLTYPGPELQQAAGELKEAVLSEALLPPALRADLVSLIDEIAAGDIYDLQERYVFLFDRTRSLSLHLFEHVHGESRDRGQAMIDLKSLYESNGLYIDAAELPDFLPMFVEFVSTRPLAEARDLLSQPAHIFEVLAERLAKRGSAYAAVFRALTALAAVRPKQDEIAALLKDPDADPSDLAALDRQWEDEQVTFGPSANACKDGLIARFRAAKRPAAQV